MKKGKYMKARTARRSGTKRLVALTLAMVLLIGGVVGGTLAWLTDKTTAVTNTFTTSDINIDLTETTGANYKMIPGHYVTKDPKVYVATGSEECWLFVQVTEAGGVVSYTPAGAQEPVTTSWGNFLTYTIAEGWTLLPGQTNVYYRHVTSAQMGEANAFAILKDNKVNVNDTVTKEMMNAISDATKPTLSFTAYAVQYYSSNDTPFDVEVAWTKTPGYTPPATP